MSEWRDIETAPKDGSRILVWGEGEMLAVIWSYYWPSMTAKRGTEEPGWVTFTGDIGPLIIASHWMPLPTPPSIPTEKDTR
jgi:hypothetical protein